MIRIRNFGTSSTGAMLAANQSLVMMNMSMSDSLMQLLMNEIAIEEADEETL